MEPADSPDRKDKRESDSEEASRLALAAAWCSHVTMEFAPSWMARHSTLSKSEAGSEAGTSSRHFRGISVGLTSDRAPLGLRRRELGAWVRRLGMAKLIHRWSSSSSALGLGELSRLLPGPGSFLVAFSRHPLRWLAGCSEASGSLRELAEEVRE